MQRHIRSGGRNRETKRGQRRMRLVCPEFWWVLPPRRSEVLPGRCRLPPPGAVSTEARLSLLSLSSFLLTPEKPRSPDPPPLELRVQTSFNIKERQIIGRFRETKPHPVTQDPSLIGVTSCHPAFLPVNWPYSSPAPFAISNPIRVMPLRVPPLPYSCWSTSRLLS